MTRPALITLTSDFGVQTQGVGAMEAAAYEIAPSARVIHLMHGLPEFDITAAARTLETLRTFPVGFHVCVCDPGVGTSRVALALKLNRGDVLIGPDNGVLMAAARLLGGIAEARAIENPKVMRREVSAIFHGRDIFTPAAAHLANGVPFADLGNSIEIDQLVAAPYEEAIVRDGAVSAEVIQVNRFGSLHLNILHEQWDTFRFELGASVKARFRDDLELELTHTRTFGDVPRGGRVILKDDYGRVELAKNMERFVDETRTKIRDKIQIALPR